MSPPSSPPSFSASRKSRSSQRTSLSIDLSSIPSLSQPSPPSNTLLVTELYDLKLFQPNVLAAIKSRMNETSPLNSFSPLPSLRRIVCSFTSIEAAIQVRQLLESEAILGSNIPVKVYFGEHTPVEDAEETRRKKLLEAPQSQKLFFISPPPSPPHGWTMRNEDPPNKEVHASDLAEALSKLGTQQSCEFEQSPFPDTPASLSDTQADNKDTSQTPFDRESTARKRSGSTIIYNPNDQGNSPDLPAVMVEDTSIGNSEIDISPIEHSGKRIKAHTPRPPVELMEWSILNIFSLFLSLLHSSLDFIIPGLHGNTLPFFSLLSFNFSLRTGNASVLRVLDFACIIMVFRISQTSFYLGGAFLPSWRYSFIFLLSYSINHALSLWQWWSMNDHYSKVICVVHLDNLWINSFSMSMLFIFLPRHLPLLLKPYCGSHARQIIQRFNQTHRRVVSSLGKKRITCDSLSWYHIR